MIARDQRARRLTSTHTRRRVMRRGFIAGLTVFLMISGVGVSYAAWTSTANTKSSASAANLAITTGGFSSAAFTFQNHALTTTGYVTVTNTTDTTSTRPASAELSFGYTGSAVLAENLTVKVWTTTSTANCTNAAALPSGALSGRWDTVATVASPIVASLSKNAAQHYCVRVASAERGNIAAPSGSSGSLTLQPSVSATLKIGDWQKTAAASVTTQQTIWIFKAFGPTPNTWYQIKNLNTNRCVDVYSASEPAGTGVIDYTCKTGGDIAGDYNQHWKFTRASGDYYDLTPRHAKTTRLDIVGGSVLAQAAVDIQVDSNTRLSQEWQLQARSANVYQLVNRSSGMCMEVLNTNRYDPEIEYAQVVCNGSTGQSYSLKEIAVDVPSMTLACSVAGSGGVSLSWSGPAIDTYNFQSMLSAGGSWTPVGDAAQGSTSITVSPSAVVGTAGQYTARAMWLTNQLSTITVWKTIGGALSCVKPPPAIDSMTCADTGTTGSTRRVQLSWNPAASASYSAQYRTAGASGNWTQITTISEGASTWTWPTTPVPGSNGSFDVRIVVGSSTAASVTALATTSVVRAADSVSSYIRCAPAAPTLQCTNTGSGNSSYRVSYRFEPANSEQFILKVLVGSTWQNLDDGTLRAGNATVAISNDYALGLADGTYEVQAQNSAGGVLGYSTIRHEQSGFWIFIDKYLRCSS